MPKNIFGIVLVVLLVYIGVVYYQTYRCRERFIEAGCPLFGRGICYHDEDAQPEQLKEELKNVQLQAR